jgi:hypothetical protein
MGQGTFEHQALYIVQSCVGMFGSTVQTSATGSQTARSLTSGGRPDLVPGPTHVSLPLVRWAGFYDTVP